jgi:Zn-dependent protease
LNLTGRQQLIAAAAVAIGVYIVVTRHIISNTALLTFAVVVPAIILHEVSHGVVALWFGDDTAKRAGRLTLNPIAHIDPFGTIILPAILALSGLGAFGYAKPVPVNVRRLRHPRNEGLLVSLAGPVTNITLAAIAVIILRVFRPAGTARAVAFVIHFPTYFSQLPLIDRALALFALVNVILAVFNLIPIPPLDGSALLERLMPASWWPGYLRFRQYSMGILLLVILLLPNALGRVFTPAIDLLASVLRH